MSEIERIAQAILQDANRQTISEALRDLYLVAFSPNDQSEPATLVRGAISTLERALEVMNAPYVAPRKWMTRDELEELYPLADGDIVEVAGYTTSGDASDE